MGDFAEILWDKNGYDPKSHVSLPVAQILEEVMPLVEPEFSLEIIPDNEMDNGNLHGETIPSQHLIRLKESVYDGMITGLGRDRMTIMHEIGHYLIHFHEELSLTKAVRERTLEPWESAEWQAKRFAGEFLMPSSEIAWMTVDEITKTYGVSREAAKFQKNNL